MGACYEETTKNYSHCSRSSHSDFNNFIPLLLFCVPDNLCGKCFTFVGDLPSVQSFSPRFYGEELGQSAHVGRLSGGCPGGKGNIVAHKPIKFLGSLAKIIPSPEYP